MYTLAYVLREVRDPGAGRFSDTASASPWCRTSMGLEDENRDYMFFDYSTSTGQLFVNDAGGDDRLGLDADKIYPVIVTASDRRGGWDKIEVGVYLDSASAARRRSLSVK